MLSIMDSQFSGATLADRFIDAFTKSPPIPFGTTFLIPAGSYAWDKTVTMDRRYNIYMEAGYIEVKLTGSDRYMMVIDVHSSGDVDNRAQIFSGVRAFISTTDPGSGYGIFRLITSSSPSANANNGVIFENLIVTGKDSGSARSSTADFAIRIDGFNTHGTVIQNCGQITGGIGLFCSDTTRIVNNMFGGLTTSIYLELSDGAFGTVISGNSSKTRDGFIYCKYASNVLCEANQVEQEGTNGSTYQASLTFEGYNADHVIRAGGSLVTTSAVGRISTILCTFRTMLKTA